MFHGMSEECLPHHGRHGFWGMCGPGAWMHGHRGHRDFEDDGGGLGAAFGVRRPLRFMAYKLELDDEQVQQLAVILNDLKTERAQAAVDGQRTIAAFAEAIAGEAFDKARAGEGVDLRVKSAEHLRDAVLRALERTHALLNPEQRQKLAYLLRAGVLTI